MSETFDWVVNGDNVPKLLIDCTVVQLAIIADELVALSGYYKACYVVCWTACEAC